MIPSPVAVRADDVALLYPDRGAAHDRHKRHPTGGVELTGACDEGLQDGLAARNGEPSSVAVTVASLNSEGVGSLATDRITTLGWFLPGDQLFDLLRGRLQAALCVLLGLEMEAGCGDLVDDEEALTVGELYLFLAVGVV